MRFFPNKYVMVIFKLWMTFFDKKTVNLTAVWNNGKHLFTLMTTFAQH